MHWNFTPCQALTVQSIVHCGDRLAQGLASDMSAGRALRPLPYGMEATPYVSQCVSTTCAMQYKTSRAVMQHFGPAAHAAAIVACQPRQILWGPSEIRFLSFFFF